MIVETFLRVETLPVYSRNTLHPWKSLHETQPPADRQAANGGAGARRPADLGGWRKDWRNPGGQNDLELTMLAATRSAQAKALNLLLRAN